MTGLSYVVVFFVGACFVAFTVWRGVRKALAEAVGRGLGW